MPIRIEDLAAKLDRELALIFSPLVEDPAERGQSMRNPNPWTCRTVDFMPERGYGTTPDEACGALVEAMILRARRHLADEKDAQKRASAALEDMINLLAGA